jgi:predicted hydrolase (HD superfamily)
VLVVLAQLQIVDKRVAAVVGHQEILDNQEARTPATLAAVDKVEPLLVVVQMVVFRKQVNLVPLET